jgi:hypothetical protein
VHVRGNVKYDDRNAHTRRLAERSLVGIKGAKFMDMAGKTIPEHGLHGGYTKDIACGEGSLRPGLEGKCDGLASNLRRRKPCCTDIKE